MQSHMQTYDFLMISVGIEVAIKSGFTDTSLIKMNCFGGFCVHLENMQYLKILKANFPKH